MTARFRDLDEILHELQRLFGQVDAVLRIAVFEYTWQTRHRAAIKEAYRTRMNSLAQLKLDLAEGEYSDIDWDMEFYTSKAKDQAQLDYASEYANLIVQEGDLETNWKNWVAEKMKLIQPYLDELNAM